MSIQNKILVATALCISIGTSTARAERLTCGIDKSNTYGQKLSDGNKNLADGSGPEKNIDVIFESEIKMNCKSSSKDKSDSNDYIVELNNLGAALRIVGFIEGLFIQCPGQKNISGNYYGIKVDADVVFGAGVGIFVQTDGIGVCYLLAGSVASFGAAVVGSHLEIKKLR